MRGEAVTAVPVEAPARFAAAVWVALRMPVDGEAGTGDAHHERTTRGERDGEFCTPWRG